MSRQLSAQHAHIEEEEARIDALTARPGLSFYHVPQPGDRDYGQFLAWLVSDESMVEFTDGEAPAPAPGEPGYEDYLEHVAWLEACQPQPGEDTEEYRAYEEEQWAVSQGGPPS